MRTMTIHDFRRILIDCAGNADNDALSGDIENTEFDQLGYDSLSLMETASRIAKEYGVQIPDHLIVELRTPREVLDVVNGAIAEAR